MASSWRERERASDSLRRVAGCRRSQGLTMPNDSLQHTLRIRHDFGLDSSTTDATSSLPAVPILASIQAIFVSFYGPKA